MNSSVIGEGVRVSVWTLRARGRFLACTALCGLGVALGGCNSQTASNSGPVDRFNQRYGVSSSPRVVAEGQSVPRGGGVYRVGRPYRVAGRTYTPFEKREGHTEAGIASWYGRQFHGRLTANGEVYDMNSLSAAHRTMPMPSYARVTNLTNGHSLIVRVNDRGPFHGNRVIDLSHRASHLLNFRGQGLARVRVEYVGRAPIEGSDERVLLATLRTDGSPAPRPGGAASGTMIASAAPQTVPDPAPRPAPATEAAPVALPVAAAPLPAPQEQPSRGFAFFGQNAAPPAGPGSVNPDLVQPNPFAAAPAQVATAPQAPLAPITMASAPLPPERPGLREAPQVAQLSAPVTTTAVARSNAPAQAVPSTVTVVAAPAPGSLPAPTAVPAQTSAPVLAAASSRPVSVPAATAFAPPRQTAPVIAAMPGRAPVRASLGFGSLY